MLGQKNIYKMKHRGLNEEKARGYGRNNTRKKLTGILKKRTENRKKAMFEEVITEVFPKLIKYIKLQI